MNDVCTTALLTTKPSSDDDSEFRHGFEAKASLTLVQNASAVTFNTTRLCWIIIAKILGKSFGNNIIINLL